MTTQNKNLPAPLPELTKDLNPSQKAFVQLSTIKADVFKDLENSELVVQGFLSKIEEVKELPVVQEKIKQAKAEFDKSKGQRLYFTGMLDEKLIQPAMAYEKRNEVLLDTAKKHELTLRIAATEEADKMKDYNAELNSLKAHITNENYRIATEYRTELSGYITMQYVQALKSKTKVKDIPKLIECIKKDLATYKPGKPNKFERKLVTDADAMKLFNEIPKYNPAENLAEAISQVDAKFLLYSQDLKNAEDAIKEAEEEEARKEQEANTNLQTETAINNLSAQSTDALVLSGGPKLKIEWKVVDVNEQPWAITIMSHFMKNIQVLKQYVKVKEWSKLSIGQMAAAIGKSITETGVQIPGIKTEKVKK